jgi:hypothetical protein
MVGRESLKAKNGTLTELRTECACRALARSWQDFKCAKVWSAQVSTV